MKTMKIMLTAIGVFAIVGGALAFKAHSAGSVIYCSSVASPAASCSQLTNAAYVVSTPPNPANGFCTTVANTSCLQRAFISIVP